MKGKGTSSGAASLCHSAGRLSGLRPGLPPLSDRQLPVGLLLPRWDGGNSCVAGVRQCPATAGGSAPHPAILAGCCCYRGFWSLSRPPHRADCGG
eukprot:scaffold487_cov178-Ochromonas_danica.AAC.1